MLIVADNIRLAPCLKGISDMVLCRIWMVRGNAKFGNGIQQVNGFIGRQGFWIAATVAKIANFTTLIGDSFVLIEN